MNEKKLNTNPADPNEADDNIAYIIPDEACCSAEFPQSCIFIE